MDSSSSVATGVRPFPLWLIAIWPNSFLFLWTLLFLIHSNVDKSPPTLKLINIVITFLIANLTLLSYPSPQASWPNGPPCSVQLCLIYLLLPFYLITYGLRSLKLLLENNIASLTRSVSFSPSKQTSKFHFVISNKFGLSVQKTKHVETFTNDQKSSDLSRKSSSKENPTLSHPSLFQGHSRCSKILEKTSPPSDNLKGDFQKEVKKNRAQSFSHISNPSKKFNYFGILEASQGIKRGLSDDVVISVNRKRSIFPSPVFNNEATLYPEQNSTVNSNHPASLYPQNFVPLVRIGYAFRLLQKLFNLDANANVNNVLQKELSEVKVEDFVFPSMEWVAYANVTASKSNHALPIFGKKIEKNVKKNIVSNSVNLDIEPEASENTIDNSQKLKTLSINPPITVVIPKLEKNASSGIVVDKKTTNFGAINLFALAVVYLSILLFQGVLLALYLIANHLSLHYSSKDLCRVEHFLPLYIYLLIQIALMTILLKKLRQDCLIPQCEIKIGMLLFTLYWMTAFILIIKDNSPSWFPLIIHASSVTDFTITIAYPVCIFFNKKFQRGLQRNNVIKKEKESNIGAIEDSFQLKKEKGSATGNFSSLSSTKAVTTMNKFIESIPLGEMEPIKLCYKMEDFLGVLKHPVLFQRLKEILKSQMNLESALFYEDYIRISSVYQQALLPLDQWQAYLKSNLLQVAASYVDEAGRTPLNLLPKTRNDFLALMAANKYSIDILEPLKSEVIKIMFDNAFPCLLKELNEKNSDQI